MITNIIIIALLVILVFKDELKGKLTKKTVKPEETSEEEEKKQREFRTQFEKLMAYSINDAIEKYKGDE